MTQPTSLARPAARTRGFRAIFEQHGTFVLRTLRRLGVPTADLHDLCQDTFVVVHRKLPDFDFDGRASIRTWIYAICVRTALAYRRSLRARREETCENPEAYTLIMAAKPKKHNHHHERRPAVDRLLAALDVAQRHDP